MSLLAKDQHQSFKASERQNVIASPGEKPHTTNDQLNGRVVNFDEEKKRQKVESTPL